LEGCNLKGGEEHIQENLLRCYEALVSADVVGRPELDLVQAWIEDCSRCEQESSSREPIALRH
jgi:hypothetical protein